MRKHLVTPGSFIACPFEPVFRPACGFSFDASRIASSGSLHLQEDASMWWADAWILLASLCFKRMAALDRSHGFWLGQVTHVICLLCHLC